MADRLVDSFGAPVVRGIAAAIRDAHPPFASRDFVRSALRGFEPLDLMARARAIAQALAGHLPRDFPQAADILVRSLGPPLGTTGGHGMAPFFYLPHSFFVAAHGLGHFEESMRAQYEITQRFTAEFSIRVFLERTPDRTLARLREWTADPSVHVRRLVSEGTRPRLPWAPRLRAFQRDPTPVLELLERLKDDPELYVRRSVANNLNDIGKDHPAIAAETARRWLAGGAPHRRWIVAHALRSAVKRAEPGALEVLGYGAAARVSISNVAIEPPRARIGGRVEIGFEVHNPGRTRQGVLVDLRVHFVKANGQASPKTFKLRALELAPGERARLSKSISLDQLTTRTHYPGVHRVEALCNGAASPLGAFDLR
ncbi:MAG TPA: hypothetical protein VEC19_17735 [Usitatibacter sp.]|nr:hypothetical protein [Usitatibacter sp.]